MPGARHPGGHDVTRRGVSRGDVLAAFPPVVAGGRHPSGHVSVVVLVGLNEVRGPPLGGLVELRRDVERREAEPQPLLIDQTVDRRGHVLHVLCAGGRVGVRARARAGPRRVRRTAAGDGPATGRCRARSTPPPPGLMAVVMTVRAVVVAAVVGRGAGHRRGNREAADRHGGHHREADKAPDPASSSRARGTLELSAGTLHSSLFGAGAPASQETVSVSAKRPHRHRSSRIWCFPAFLVKVEPKARFWTYNRARRVRQRAPWWGSCT